MAQNPGQNGSSRLTRLEVARKTGSEGFVDGERSLGFKLMDFWRWSSSDLVSNATRGILAEFIVAMALGAADNVRGEWDSYDVIAPSGIKVEVKSAAYIQSWHQDRLSRISFGISARKGWDADTGVFQKQARRHADVYVFCLLAQKDQIFINPLDLSQWKFYVLPTTTLNSELPGAKSINLKTLSALCARETEYVDLGEAVRKAGRVRAQ